MPDQLRALGHHASSLANTARLGCIAALDGDTARVSIGDVLTDFLPFMHRRAAHDADWWQPEIGEQVVVLSLWGDISQGVILGSISQEAYPPPTQGSVWGKRFRDGTTLTYDPESHVLNVNAGQSPLVINCQNVSLTAQNVALNTPSVTCTGTITAQGDVVAGGVSLKGHHHSGVQPGSGKTGGPN